MMLIGQDKIIENIDRYNTFVDFPGASLFVGEHGAGKHTVCYYIAEKFSVSIKEITDSVGLDTVEEMIGNPLPTIYIINTIDLTVKEQNALLKVLEEPTKNIKLMLLCENIEDILPTIYNRCIVFRFNHYTRSQLASFLSDTVSADILTYVSTPGQVLEAQNYNIEELCSLCDLMINKISVAGEANILKNSLRFDFRTNKQKLEEKESDIEKYKDKFSVSLFFSIMLNKLKIKYIENSNDSYYNAYVCTSNSIKTLKTPNCDKKNVFERYLLSIKNILKDC